MSAHPLPTLPPASAADEQPERTLSQAAVIVSALEKRFDVRPVLRGVTFSLPEGGTMALLGPNGAGKTTLLRVLATLVKPSQGAATVAGYNVERDADQVRRAVGYVGHQPHTYDDLTARENLLFFARMYGLRDGPDRAARLLERVGLARRANDLVRTLSRGQTQRLALARGILHDPIVLLLDEPDTGLDDEAAALLDSLLAERADAGLTTLFTTHQLERGLRLSESTLVLITGHVAYYGTSTALDARDVRGLCDQKARSRA
jgi:heme ABC exporter ATP-binding subunit CcmA